jgi:hypothetical protein
LQQCLVTFYNLASTYIYFDDDLATFDDKPDMPDDGFKYFRIFGWQTINGKLYWLFTYTLGNSWGINNYKLVEHGKFSLQFINYKLIY